MGLSNIFDETAELYLLDLNSSQQTLEERHIVIVRKFDELRKGSNYIPGDLNGTHRELVACVHENAVLALPAKGG